MPDSGKGVTPRTVIAAVWSGAIRISRQVGVTGLVAILAAALYAILVCSHGIPALRHDWSWPTTREGFVGVFWDAVSGWTTSGLGQPNAYPSGYVVGPIISALGIAFGPYIALFLYAFAIGLICTLAARSLAFATRSTIAQTCVIESFLLFNPWVYNETVAGHTYMVLAYGGLCGLLAEMIRSNARTVRLSSLVLLTLPQLQFFIGAVVALFVYGVLRRTVLPLAFALVVGLPIWVGIVMDRAHLLRIPYLLAWQHLQSVDPVQSLTLRGYFTHYAATLGLPATVAMCALFFIVCISAMLNRYQRQALAALALAGASLAIAMGTRGPLSAFYVQLIRAVPESAVVRELYDLLGLTGIAYAILLALPLPKIITSIVQPLAALLLVVAWLCSPPSVHWLNAANIPAIAIHAPENTRYALYPAFQPLQFHKAGSGTDPQAYARGNNITPINQYLAQYPVNVALVEFAKTGKPAYLESLSVSDVVFRPSIQTDLGSLAHQNNGFAGIPEPRSLEMSLHAMPEVSIGSLPRVGSLVNAIGSGNILFSDAGLGTINIIRAPNDDLTDSAGWVDVRFDYLAHPALAQAFGGAVTTNSRITLPVSKAAKTLVNVDGHLMAQDGRLITGSTQGYRWIRIPTDATALRCQGRCVVAAQTSLPDPPLLNPPPGKFEPVQSQMLTPWLIRLGIGPHARALLRYNVSYDNGWNAIVCGASLHHVRIDAVVNGWTVPPSRLSCTAYLVHSVAFLQAISELVAVACIMLILYMEVREATALPGFRRDRRVAV